MKRREFIRLTAQLSAFAGLAPFLSVPTWAQTTSASRFKYLITVHFDGGWDVLYGLDPKTKPASVNDLSYFIGYGEQDIIQAANLRFGPAAAALKPVANHCIVVNGVSMLGNVSHPDNSRMTQTGIIDRHTAQIAALKAYVDAGSEAAILANESIEAGQLNIVEKNVYDIKSITQPPTENELFLDADGSMAQYKSLQFETRQNLAKIFAQQPKLQEMAKPDELPIANAIALAFLSQLTRTAHIQIGSRTGFTLDTHSNHKARHGAAQADCWAQVMDIVNILKSIANVDGQRSLFDETLVVVTSEFSRETALNGSSVENSGKEHNGYTNSFLLMGGGVNGGFSVGESVVQSNMLGKPTLHAARNFDFRSGKPIHSRNEDRAYMADPSIKKQIQPGHVVATLADAFGYRDLLDPVLAKLPTLKLF